MTSGNPVRHVGLTAMLDAMKMAMNAAMEPILQRAAADDTEPDLPPELEELLRAGLVRSGERLYLARPEHKTPPPDHLDDFESERWMNTIHLDNQTSEPSWRIELLRQGLTVAKRLLPQAITLTLTQLPVQIVISLQSAPDAIDPEIDFATGALHLTLIRSAQDDFASHIQDDVQPVLAITATRAEHPGMLSALVPS